VPRERPQHENEAVQPRAPGSGGWPGRLRRRRKCTARGAQPDGIDVPGRVGLDQYPAVQPCRIERSSRRRTRPSARYQKPGSARISRRSSANERARAGCELLATRLRWCPGTEPRSRHGPVRSQVGRPVPCTPEPCGGRHRRGYIVRTAVQAGDAVQRPDLLAATGWSAAGGVLRRTGSSQNRRAACGCCSTASSGTHVLIEGSLQAGFWAAGAQQPHPSSRGCCRPARTAPPRSRARPPRVSASRRLSRSATTSVGTAA
jgi:hypothetical protein